MKTKDKIGIIVLLGGIALLGIYFFKKKKLTVASSQANKLERESDLYKKGIIKDDTVIKGFNLQNTKIDRYGGLFGLSDKDRAELEKHVESIGMPKIDFSGLKFMDFSNIPDFSKIDWSKVDFSKIKKYEN
jgi:hypothetical protein